MTITGDRDLVRVSVEDARIREDEVASIPLWIQRADANGEQIVSVLVRGLPRGAELTDGSGRSLVIAAEGAVELLDWEWSSLRVKPPVDFSGVIGLSVDVISDASEDAIRTRHWQVTVDAVADLARLQVEPAKGFQFTWLPLSVRTGITDADRSETLELRARGIPAGSRLTDGVNLFVSEGPQQWVSLTNWNLNSLAFMGIALADRNVELTLESITTEVSNGDRAVQVAVLRIDAPPQPFVNFDEATVGPTRDAVVVERAVNAAAASTTGDTLADLAGLLVVSEEVAEAQEGVGEEEELETGNPNRRGGGLDDLVMEGVERRKREEMEWSVEQLERRLLELQGDVRFERVGQRVAEGEALMFQEDLEQLAEVRRLSEEIKERLG